MFECVFYIDCMQRPDFI